MVTSTIQTQKQKLSLDDRLEIAIEPKDTPVRDQKDEQQGEPETAAVYEIKIPAHIQESFDRVLDFYAKNGQKPQIKLCGNPLDAVTGFIKSISETLPDSILNAGKDMMDFIIQNLCEFCRDRSMNYMTFHFTFDRGVLD